MPDSAGPALLVGLETTAMREGLWLYPAAMRATPSMVCVVLDALSEESSLGTAS